MYQILHLKTRIMIDKRKEYSRPLSPMFNEDIYEKLPIILENLVRFGHNRREKDILLLSGLTTYGAIACNMIGLYRDDILYPNLFSCIIAPAASGKGVMNKARKVAEKIQKELLLEYQTKVNKYNQEVEEAKNDKSKIAPQKPKRQLFLIPGNITGPAIIDNLQNNNGTGLIIESEIDTVSFANKGEFGKFSDMLRKGFHHETISVSRKTDSEFIEVENPRFAIAVSGTPGQITGLLSSAEDGLFSRMCFYTFSDKRVINVRPRKNYRSIKTEFESLQQTVLKFWEWQNNNQKETQLTDEQWDALNRNIINWEKDFSIISVELESTAIRLGVIAFKIMMILTACRAFESMNPNNEIFVTPQDFNTAISIAETLRYHSELVYNNLPKKNSTNGFKTSNKWRFWLELPDSFARKEAIEIGKKYEMAQRTVDDFLKNQIEHGNLERISAGNYKKTA